MTNKAHLGKTKEMKEKFNHLGIDKKKKKKVPKREAGCFV